MKHSATAAARVLLEAQAPCDTRDCDDRTLLMWAASCGNIEIMKLLIQRGVGIKAKDSYGRTAMQCELLRGRGRKWSNGKKGCPPGLRS